MNIISFNICGTGNTNKRKSLRALLSKHKVNFLALQETFMSSHNLLRLRSMWGNYHFNFEEVLSNDHSGGIVSMWDPSVFAKDMVYATDNFLIVGGRWLLFDLPCFMVNVYAPQSEIAKCGVWHDILSFKQNNLGNYVVFGDFNSVRSQEERLSSMFSAVNASHFNEFITSGDLVDIPLGGSSFTRFSPNGLKASKLDRFLVSPTILNNIQNMEGLVIDGLYSDHRLILLTQNLRDFGPIPFKLFNSWMDQPGFEELVRNKWSTLADVFVPKVGKKFATKLKSLKNEIKVWRKSHLSGSLDIADLRQQLKFVEQQLANGPVSMDAVNLRSSLLL